MHFELKSVNVWTMIKTWFFLNLFIGLAIGIVYAFLSMLTLAAVGDPLLLRAGLDPEFFSSGMLLFMMPIVFALLHAFFGTVLVAVLSVVYNVTARVIGGLQFEMVPDEDSSGEVAAPTAADAAAIVTPSPEPSRADVQPPSPERTSEYAPPPPPPPPLGTVRPDPPKAPERPSPFPETIRPKTEPRPFAEPSAPAPIEPPPAKPPAPNEAETPTAEWPVPPPTAPKDPNNDKPENRTDQ